MSFTENLDGATLSRTWFDNVTTTSLTFMPVDGANAIKINRGGSTTLHFGAGNYQFNASFNYPQLKQLSPQAVLNDASRGLVGQFPDQTTSLSFLSYTDKLLAGTWRFLTYFGRDSMLSLLLLQPVLSEGENGAIEAVIRAVLERINRNDGSTCHEEVIGDYATFLNLQKGIVSTDPQCDYKMIDTDYYLPIILKNYFVDTETGRKRAGSFLDASASFLPNHGEVSYGKLAQLTAEKIMKASAKFASDGGQTKDNLIHLNEGEQVGEWRDSNGGLGGGRIPYDVNTALVPAALRSIAALSAAGIFPDHPEWNETANKNAQIWEDQTLRFFEVVVPKDEASSLLSAYVSDSSFPGPIDALKSDIKFHGLALDGKNDQPIVRVMNTDDCFRHFLLNTTNQTQLSAFLDQTADNILQPFPVGLSSDVGLFVANPAYGGDPLYAARFTNRDYHGTVVWGWQLAMMAAGLARQLGRCESSSNVPGKSNRSPHCRIGGRVTSNSSSSSHHSHHMIESC
jgi:glycogen debranching enzyme